MAHVVVAEVRRCLPADVVLNATHLWLAVLPDPNMNQGVWDVVCLAALLAINMGRSESHTPLVHVYFYLWDIGMVGWCVYLCIFCSIPTNLVGMENVWIV